MLSIPLACQNGVYARVLFIKKRSREAAFFNETYLN